MAQAATAYEQGDAVMVFDPATGAQGAEEKVTITFKPAAVKDQKIRDGDAGEWNLYWCKPGNSCYYYTGTLGTFVYAGEALKSGKIVGSGAITTSFIVPKEFSTTQPNQILFSAVYDGAIFTSHINAAATINVTEAGSNAPAFTLQDITGTPTKDTGGSLAQHSNPFVTHEIAINDPPANVNHYIAKCVPDANFPEYTRALGDNKTVAANAVKVLPSTTNNQTRFECDYPATAGSYQVEVTAYSSADESAKIASVTTTVAITGQEKTEAELKGSSSASSVPGSALKFLADWVISPMIELITTIIYWVFSIIVSPLIEAVLAIHPYKDVFVQVIYPGWLILRNLSNIAFIIVLLVIGLATLFQVEKYNYKHLLVKVIIAAVLVNFSLVIGQSVLGLADTVQNQFLPQQGAVVRALGYELMVKPVQQIQTKDDSLGGGLSNITYPFFLLALALGAFLAFVAILVFLVVRIVGLWILLMVSPVAYVANVLPETQKYFSEWWSKFLAYAFITPIFAFFLNIAALFATSHVFSQGSPVFNTGTINGNISDFVYLTAGHITVLVFLFAGLSFAGSSGVVGAKAVTDWAKKGMSLPFKAAAGLAKAGGERTLEAASQAANFQLDPRVWAKEWQHYREDKKRERLQRLESSGGVFSKPYNAFDSYANWHGIKRVSKLPWTGTATGVGKRLDAANAEKKAAGNLLTDDQRSEGTKALDALREEFKDLPSGTITKDRAREISELIGSTIEDYQGKIKELVDPKEGLAGKLDAQGRVQEAAKARADAAKLQSDIDQLKKVNQELDSQIMDPSQDKVGINLAKAQITDADLKKFFGDNIFDTKAVEDQIKNDIKKINDDLQNDANARVLLNVKGSLDKSGVEKMKIETRKTVNDLEKLLSQVKRPEFYHARLARTAAQAEELKKLKNIDDAEELKRYLHDALHEKNIARVGAILEKLSQDNNFNEVLEGKDLDGNPIVANAQGAQKYFEKIAHETGMSKSHMMQLASEISYINEGLGGFSFARITKSTPGGLEWSSPLEQLMASYGEASKRPYRDQAKYPRWSYVDQIRDEETGGWKTIGLNMAGMANLKQASFNPDAIKSEFRRNYKANTAVAITQLGDWEKKLKDLGIKKAGIDLVRDVAGESEGDFYIGNIKLSGVDRS